MEASYLRMKYASRYDIMLRGGLQSSVSGKAVHFELAGRLVNERNGIRRAANRSICFSIFKGDLMLNQPMVSIVIPVYNGSNYVACAIDSALAQTYPNCEVIVVNDGSNDEGRTEAICRSYGDRIRYFSQPNGGVASALNCGVRNMRGEYFSWLSHDDLFLPEKTSHQMKELETFPADTILYSDYYMLYPEIHMKAKVDFSKKYPNEMLDVPLYPVFFGLISGCTILFHKSHFDRVGLFDETLLTTLDYEFWFRAFQGQKVHYCKHTDVCIRLHKQQGSRTIPEVEANVNQLWCSLVEQAPALDKCRISGTIYLFYRDMERLFRRFGCAAVEQRCAELAQAELDARNQTERSEERVLFDLVSAQYEQLAAKQGRGRQVRVFTWGNLVAAFYAIWLNGPSAVLRHLR